LGAFILGAIGSIVVITLAQNYISKQKVNRVDMEDASQRNFRLALYTTSKTDESLKVREEDDVIVSYKHYWSIIQVQRVSVIICDFLVCLGHGSNDVANTISPLLIIFKQEGYPDNVAKGLGAFGIGLGLLALGWKVMETVGKKMIKLDYTKGFAVQFATAFTVIFASLIKLPVSTTHLCVGAMIGAQLGSQSPIVKKAYHFIDLYQEATGVDDHGRPLLKEAAEVYSDEKDENSDGPNEDASKDSKSLTEGLNLKIVLKIFLWWGITVPFALITTLLCTLLLEAF
jgi:phosphate/sulfate permease